MSSNMSAGQIVGTIVGAVISYFLPGSYVFISADLPGRVGKFIDEVTA